MQVDHRVVVDGETAHEADQEKHLIVVGRLRSKVCV